eukprot:g10453.t1
MLSQLQSNPRVILVELATSNGYDGWVPGTEDQCLSFVWDACPSGTVCDWELTWAVLSARIRSVFGHSVDERGPHLDGRWRVGIGAHGCLTESMAVHQSICAGCKDRKRQAQATYFYKTRVGRVSHHYCPLATESSRQRPSTSATA